MSEHDAAFLWETEALRSSRHRGEVPDRPSAPLAPRGPWATLREAHYETGIPVETLRKWARRGAVPSFLNESEVGVRRMVRMEAVRERARALGRPIAPIRRPPEAPLATPPTPTAPPVEAPPTEAGPVPEDDKDKDFRDEEAAPMDATAAGPTPSGPPEGTMIVPIAAWDKMLMQLGNLHQAGQQLAEARERAAKAETEATFLRERLGEMRRELAESRSRTPERGSPPTDEEPREETPEDGTAEAQPEPEALQPDLRPTAAPQTEKLWRYIYRGWRARRRP